MIFDGAPGEIIAYTDNDCVFTPDWLEKSLRILETYPNTGMVTARPFRTREDLYTATLAWADADPDPSGVYRVLRDMEKRGLVSSRIVHDKGVGLGRKVYSLTEDGIVMPDEGLTDDLFMDDDIPDETVPFEDDWQEEFREESQEEFQEELQEELQEEALTESDEIWEEEISEGDLDFFEETAQEEAPVSGSTDDIISIG